MLPFSVTVHEDHVDALIVAECIGIEIADLRTQIMAVNPLLVAVGVHDHGDFAYVALDLAFIPERADRGVDLTCIDGVP